MKKVIFARIGWMKYYKGPQKSDPKPIGGGEYNISKIGFEAFNFMEMRGRFLGFVQHAGHAMNLNRISPKANKDYIDGVLVVFVARHPTEYGQRIVGWYERASVLRRAEKSEMRQRMRFSYNIIASPKSSVLLPTYMRTYEIPSGRNGLGQSNITYVLDYEGMPKKMPWVRAALDYVSDYDGPNLVSDEDSELDQVISEVYEREEQERSGQGFGINAEVRTAITEKAMAVAAAYYRRKGYIVTDVSKIRSFDLHCKRGNRVILVEVKGSQGPIKSIILTSNERTHAEKNWSWLSLCLVSDIIIKYKGKKAVGRGGRLRIIYPWRIKKENLKALSYVYRLG